MSTPNLLVPATSERLRRLADEHRVRGNTAVTEFWAEVRATGTPLVEPAEDPADRVATFVWRGDSGTDGALVMVNTAVEAHRADLAPARMQRLPGTDVWHRSFRFPAGLRASYQLLPLDPTVELSRVAEPAVWMGLRAKAGPDPLGREELAGWLPGMRTSVFALPDAPAQPWFGPRPDGDAPGTLERHDIDIDPARGVWVYQPAGYSPRHGPYPVLVLLDGDLWAGPLGLRHILDGLIVEGLLPPVLALLVGSPAPDSAVSFADRNAELAAPGRMTALLRDELLPWLRRRWPISADPAATVVAGQSLGGSAALTAALDAPERFGAVLCQSGAFQHDGGALLGRVRDGGTPPPIRAFVEVGSHEWRLLADNRRLGELLPEWGVPTRYREYVGGHDPACWRGGLATGLIELLGRAGSGTPADGH